MFMLPLKNLARKGLMCTNAYASPLGFFRINSSGLESNTSIDTKQTSQKGTKSHRIDLTDDCNEHVLNVDTWYIS